jgi:hypothetical protein
MKFVILFSFACVIGYVRISTLLQRSTTTRYHYRARGVILQSETIL